MKRLAFLAAVACLCGCALNGAARAGSLSIVVQSTSALPGTLGQFDVDLVNNSASAVTIGAFSVDVLLTDTTFVTFTAIDNATTAPYIFSITGSFPPGFVSQLLPMEATGNDLAASAGQVVNPGETWGLAHVKYLVDPAAPLGTVVPMVLEQFPQNFTSGETSLTDPNGASVPFTGLGRNGTITVGAPTTAVPEPATLTLMGLGVGCLAGYAWRRKRRLARFVPK
jgi:hypothetical protein